MGNEVVDNVLDSQPVAVVEAVKALLVSIVTTAVLFGLKLTADQLAGIVLVLGNVLAVATVLIVPRRVNTNATLANAQKDAYLTGVAEGKDGAS